MRRHRSDRSTSNAVLSLGDVTPAVEEMSDEEHERRSPGEGLDSSRSKGDDEILNDLNGEKMRLWTWLDQGSYCPPTQAPVLCSSGRLPHREMPPLLVRFTVGRSGIGKGMLNVLAAHSALTGSWQPAAQNMKPRFQSRCAPVEQSVSEDNHDLVFVLGDNAIESRFSPTWRPSGGHWHGTRCHSSRRQLVGKLVSSPFINCGHLCIGDSSPRSET